MIHLFVKFIRLVSLDAILISVVLFPLVVFATNNLYFYLFIFKKRDESLVSQGT